MTREPIWDRDLAANAEMVENLRTLGAVDLDRKPQAKTGFTMPVTVDQPGIGGTYNAGARKGTDHA